MRNAAGTVHGVIGAQGLYYLLSGLWPLLHMDSFLWVTGPKTDLWLVQTVGVLVTAIGVSLLTAWRRTLILPETLALGAVSAAGLAVIDIFYVIRGTLRPVYLADALPEIIFFLTLTLALALYGRLNVPSGRI